MWTKRIVFTILLSLGFALPACASPSTQPAPPAPVTAIPPTNDMSRNPAELPGPSRGQLLYENHCSSCHESVIRIRTRQHTKSLSELQTQVSYWAEYLKLNWGIDDVRQVTAHLNNHYYKFKAH